ncbi:MAG: DUF4194 domain-containing protein [Ardenticatenaceae bacterium]
MSCTMYLTTTTQYATGALWANTQYVIRNMKKEPIEPYAPVVLKLFKNILYYDDAAHWALLLRYATPIHEYFGKIGLVLQINEAEGYAYVQQPDAEDEQAIALPRLTRRTALTYHQTLMCVLLRERLQQFDARELASSRLVLSKDEILDLVWLFFAQQNDEVRLVKKIDPLIKKMVEIGVLKRLNSAEGEQYEVRRILKAMISADILVEIKEKIDKYEQSNA